MRPFPDADDYIRAVQNPQSSFTSADLRTASFALHPIWQIPMPASGNAAVVFRADVDGAPRALRFFIRDAADREHYDRVARHVDTHGLGDLVAAARWIDDAVLIRQHRWPAVSMEWIDGLILDHHLDDLTGRSDTTAIERLATSWLELLDRLQRNGFSHGDLQHTNVLVDRDGALRLVDLDEVWVDDAATRDTAAAGPGAHREVSTRRRWRDTFPGLVVYLALLALARRPRLWSELRPGENLLFSTVDFRPPFDTPVWRSLSELSDERVTAVATVLQRCCAPGWTPAGSLRALLTDTVLDAVPAVSAPAPASAAAAQSPAPAPAPGPAPAERRTPTVTSPDDTAVPPATPRNGGIFLSYRREDTEHLAGRLSDKLIERFGVDQVFMDVDSIEPGMDYADAIEQAVARCQVVLVLIGQRWAGTGQQGRRIDDPDDFVVIEVKTALRRRIPVIPVLADGAPVPDRLLLPPDLQPLSRRQVVRVDHVSFKRDASELISHLGRLMNGRENR